MDIRVDKKTAVIFDLDDTLYNEIEFLKSAYRQIAENLSGNNWKLLLAQMLSLYRSGEDVFGFLSDTYRQEKDELLHQYRHHTPRIRPFDGAIRLLEDIRRCNGKAGIITDGRSYTQRNKIKALGVESYMDHIVISEEVGTQKPESRNFEVMAEMLGAERYFYIADNLSKDFIAPNQLGWNTIGLIDNGLNIHKESFRFMKEPYMPHGFILSLEELQISH